MTTIITRSGKGTPLTNNEVDTNFTNLNTDKLELGGTFTSGTANSVLYLNGSKVATSGSALTFNGTTLLKGGADSAFAVVVSGVSKAVRLGMDSAGGFVEGVDNTGVASYQPLFVGGSDLRFLMSGSERMRLNSTSLNIGGNFTSTNNTLQVTGNTAIGYTTAAPTTGLIVAGNVGIGTDSPGVKLEVSGSATAARISGLSATVPQLQLVSGGVVNWSLRANNDGGSDFTIFQDSTQRVKIDSSGTLILRQSSNAANTSVSFNTTVQNALTLDSSGRFGVGTASPLTKLNVEGGEFLLRGGQLTIGPTAGGNGAGAIRSTLNGVLGSLIFQTEDSNAALVDRMTLDSSGNLGLGVTPSAWTIGKVLQVGTVSAFWDFNNNTYLTNNRKFESGNKYLANGYATSYEQSEGKHLWLTAASGTAGDPITFTTPMTLDASGRLGIGTTSPGSFDAVADDLVVGNGIGNIGITIYSADTGRGSILFADGTAAGGADSYRGFIEYDHSGNNFLRFGTNAVERVRIASDGTVFMRDGTSTTNTNSSKLVVNGTISETVSSVQYLVASQADIGTAPNEIPLNQYLGNLAYQDAGSIAGQVGLSAGTAALPSLVSATDTDTGMWFPAANTLAWSTNGTRAMTVDSSQRIGIGTDSPGAKLHVSGNFQVGTTSDYVRLNQTNTNVFAWLCSPLGDYSLYFDTLRGNLGLGVPPSAWSSSFKALNIGVNGQSVSADGGQIIIGSNYVQESGGARYVVSAAAGSYAIVRNSHSWYIAPSGTAGNALTFTQAMTLNASGYLGLGGTTSPSYFLDITGNPSAAANNSPTGSDVRLRNIYTRSRANSAGISGGLYAGQLFHSSGGAQFEIYNADNDALVFGTNATERARITSDGQVLIGANTSSWSNTYTILQLVNGSLANYSPTKDFRITSNAYSNSGWKYLANGSSSQILLDGSSTNGVIAFYSAATGTAGNATTNGVNAAGDTVLSVSRTNSVALEGALSYAGTGITFPATQNASSNANTLDDYEEGTWSPTISGTGSAPTITYGSQVGLYTKVGNQVTIHAAINFTARTGGSGAIAITGIPFNVNSTTNFAATGALEIGNTDFGAGYTSVHVSGFSANNYINLRKCGDNVVETNIEVGDLPTATSTWVRFSITYTV